MSLSIRQIRTLRPVVALCALTFVSTVSFAQDGVSNASAARSRYMSGLGELPAAHDITVEDFVNYHRHEIGRPKAGDAVGVDVRWGSASVAPGGEAVLQVGLSTALAGDRQNLRPLNLSLVIDKSGSMAADNKMVRVKQALTKLVSRLRPTDMLSIVVFDSKAHVILPAQRLTNKDSVRQIIREIEPGSSTNLSGGLLLGYEQALAHFDRESTNRVMLLTDGIANQGIVDPKEIAAESAKFNERGIDLSTIGVGQDLNQNLLRDLAKSGRGLFHFVADSEDIEKVFVKELESLISPVAQEPTLQIDFNPSLKLEKVYGYTPKVIGNHVSIKLDNMNSGMTEVVLMRFRAPESAASEGDGNERRFAATAEVKYYDLDGHKSANSAGKATIQLGSLSLRTAADSSVTKNFTIASLAQAMKEMARQCETKNYRQAQKTLEVSIGETTRAYPHLEDPDIDRTLKIAMKYADILRKQVGTSVEESDDAPSAATQLPLGHIALKENLLPNGDFALGNIGFESALPYIQPAENCLWDGSYTIAPKFNEPLLHRLVEREAFASPERSRDGEQVFFANAGGSDTMTVVSMKTGCKPNTRYRIRFQGTCLSQTTEYIPAFEIRANGDRSEPQRFGFHVYREISFEWNSGNSRSASIELVRMPMNHNCGIIGIANIEMTAVRY